jgi:hypothetical protein
VIILTFIRQSRRTGGGSVFSSYRPAPGDMAEKRNAHLWYADREGNGWGEPVFMSAANKLGSYHFLG